MYSFWKRFLDLALSVFGLLILGIPLTLLCLLKALFERQNPLFFQERTGRDLKPFVLWKIRTMGRDGKTNRFDRFLRRYSIDELPQLVNILKGDMSWVGYRPVVPAETELISLRDRRGVYRLRPGLTGWAQIHGRDRLAPTEKAELDAYYTEHISFSLDLKILAKTVVCVLQHRDVREK